MAKIPVVSPVGIIADTRTVQNSGVRLNELPPSASPAVRAPNNGQMVSTGVAMIADYEERQRNTKMEVNWLKNPKFGKQ
jgi:hypothetical protein